MAGQPTPPTLLQAFATAAVADDIVTPIPQPSQVSINPGAASLNDGFPPACFADPAFGGVLPSGADFNGILYMISAWAAYLGAGQPPYFDADLATFMEGYAAGSEIASSTVGTKWTAMLDGLTNDPDSDLTGWRCSVAQHIVSTLTAGTHTNVSFVDGSSTPLFSDLIVDVDTTAGDVEVDGFVPNANGQRVTWANIGTGLLKIGANVGAPANQVRMGSTLLIGAGDSDTFLWTGSLSKWILE